MKNIVLVGVGSIGKRHLQALLMLEEKINIYLYDKNIEEIEKNIIEIKESNQEKHEIFIIKNIEELPEKIELLIIATSSNVRRMLFEKIINIKKIENVIFEKVLFQKIEDYYEVEKILNDKKINAWVNCARREWKSYQKIKSILEKATKMEITISGSKWGLGCNGIHMLDLIEYISGNGNIIVDISELEENYIESKRDNFLEIEGTIKGRMGKCDNYSITSYSNNKVPVSIVINSDIFKCIINEEDKTILYANEESEWEWKEEKFETVYQSQLTNIVVENILKNKRCNLIEYKKSMELHLKYIEPLIEYFEKLGIGGKQCPIT